MPADRSDGAFPWLVPHVNPSAPSTSVLCWVCGGERAVHTIRARETGRQCTVSLSKRLGVGKQTLFLGTAVFDGLAPNTRQVLQLGNQGSDAVLDEAWVRTWPERLKGRDDPFCLLLGSCFSKVSKSGNNVRGLAESLKDARLPHLKLLCGDQVYLDIPVLELIPSAKDEMETFIVDKYLTNWSPRRDDAQFGKLLRRGTNLFLSDDHEFWNNYPFPLIYSVTLDKGLGGAERAAWFAEAARAALAAFQRVDTALRSFRIGGGREAVNLFALDGRVQRDKGTERAHPKEALRALKEGLRASSGPAIVCLSQPLLQPAAGHLGRICRKKVTDLVLSDLTDFPELVDALAACPHDILLLSGDIHGGRIASVARTRGKIVEVIASPLSLVKPGDFCSDLPTHKYPGISGSHAPYGPIRVQSGPVESNHAALLSLSRQGPDIAVDVAFVESGTGHTIKTNGPPSSFVLRSRP